MDELKSIERLEPESPGMQNSTLSKGGLTEDMRKVPVTVTSDVEDNRGTYKQYVMV